MNLLTFLMVNTLRPRQDGRHFPDDNFKCIFLNENEWISLKISLKFVHKGPINNIPALVQIMAWRQSGDKPLSEPVMVSLPTHICVTRPQWVNSLVRRQSHDWLSTVGITLKNMVKTACCQTTMENVHNAYKVFSSYFIISIKEINFTYSTFTRKQC